MDAMDNKIADLQVKPSIEGTAGVETSNPPALAPAMKNLVV